MKEVEISELDMHSQPKMKLGMRGRNGVSKVSETARGNSGGRWRWKVKKTAISKLGMKS